jgi:hypothetical protein
MGEGMGCACVAHNYGHNVLMCARQVGAECIYDGVYFSIMWGAIIGTRSEVHSPTPATKTRNRRATSENLLSALRNTLHTQIKLYSDPTHAYHSLYPKDVVLSIFSATFVETP